MLFFRRVFFSAFLIGFLCFCLFNFSFYFLIYKLFAIQDYFHKFSWHFANLDIFCNMFRGILTFLNIANNMVFKKFFTFHDILKWMKIYNFVTFENLMEILKSTDVFKFMNFFKK